MKPFEDDPMCEKCGAFTPKRQFKSVFYEAITFELMPMDWLSLSCFRCGYAWNMHCKPKANPEDGNSASAAGKVNRYIAGGYDTPIHVVSEADWNARDERLRWLVAKWTRQYEVGREDDDDYTRWAAHQARLCARELSAILATAEGE